MFDSILNGVDVIAFAGVIAFSWLAWYALRRADAEALAADSAAASLPQTFERWEADEFDRVWPAARESAL